MKAIVLTEYGGPDKLIFRDHPEPEPKAGEVKVRVASASVNPIDWKLRSGHARAIMPLQFPAVLGRDAAGTVVSVGPGVTTFQPGDRVMGLVHGAYAEFVVAPEGTWAKLADGLDVVEAGALPLALLTADQLVVAALGALGSSSEQGAVVLVTGAAGTVGRAAVFLAKERGARVIAGVRGRQMSQGAQLGADSVIALDDDRQIAGLPELDALADTVGGPTVIKLLEKMKRGGVVGSVVGEPAGARERGLVVNAFLTRPNGPRLFELGALVGAGKLVIPVAQRFTLAEGRAAQELAEGGGVGKVLILP